MLKRTEGPQINVSSGRIIYSKVSVLPYIVMVDCLRNPKREREIIEGNRNLRCPENVQDEDIPSLHTSVL